MPDGFALLQQQHREVEALFERYAEDADHTVAREICDRLTLHAEMEQQALYPELRRIVDDGDDLADRAEDEHGAVRTLIARVYDSPSGDLRPLVAELERAVATHVEFEESRLFPEMREVGVDPSELERRLQAARARPGRSCAGRRRWVTSRM